MNESLSPLECDFLWESYGVGDLPYPLGLRSHGQTMDERAALRGETLELLARRGVVLDDGDLHPQLAAQFEVLASAEVSVDAVHLVELQGSAVRAIAAASAGIGVLAVQSDAGLRMSEIPADGLASAIVALLPQAKRGTERSVSLPVDAVPSGATVHRPSAAAAGGRGDGHPATSVDHDRKSLARLQAQPRLRGGQIATNRRTELGIRSRSAVLSWFDTDSGRYLTRRSVGGDGREWVVIAPADAATLRHSIAEMLT